MISSIKALSPAFAGLSLVSVSTTNVYLSGLPVAGLIDSHKSVMVRSGPNTSRHATTAVTGDSSNRKHNAKTAAFRR